MQCDAIGHFKLYQPPIDDRLSRIDAFNSDGCLVSQLLHNVPTVSLRVHRFLSSIPPERVVELGHDPGALADRALVVRVDFVNVKVEHGRELGCLTRAVLSLDRVRPADHHEAITEAEPSHDASVRVVQPSLLSKAECAGQKLQRGSLVGLDKAKLQPFGCWLPLTEVLQWLHEVPAVAFGIDRFVVTVTPPCVFEGSADHGAGCRRAVEMLVKVDHDVHLGRGLAGLTRAVEVVCSGPERPIINGCARTPAMP